MAWKCLRDGVEGIIVGFSEGIDTVSFFFLHLLPSVFLPLLRVNRGTVSKTVVGKFLRVRVERIIMGFSGGIDAVSNSTELN